MPDQDPSLQKSSAEDLLISDTTLEALKYADDVLTTAEQEIPDFGERLQNSAKELHQATPGCSLPFLVIPMFEKRHALDRAIAAVPTTKADNAELRTALGIVHLLDFTTLACDGFRDVLSETQETETPEKKLELLSRRSLPSSYAIQAAKELRESGHLMTQIEVVRKIVACQIATVLSGKATTYRRVQASLRSAADRIDEETPGYAETRQYLDNEPENLHVHASTKEDPQATFVAHLNAINFATAAEQLDISGFKNDRELESTLKSRRSALLRYAKETAFDPTLISVFKNAQRKALPKTKESLPTIEPTLDWEILPYGEVATFAREVVESVSHESKKATIDLERLQILENIHQWWGKDSSYYQKGIRKKRRIVKDGEKEVPDEYILLVLQEKDDAGELICEHAIAESPVAGPNALHVQRYDVNHWDWRELMQYPKPDIGAMGVRPVKHVAPVGENMIENVTEKVKYLLSCAPEEFNAIEFKGRKANGNLRIQLGRVALSDSPS